MVCCDTAAVCFGQVADGDKAGEKIARDRDAQRDTVAALSRDIAAVKQREEAYGKKLKKKDGGLARLSEGKAAVRLSYKKIIII